MSIARTRGILDIPDEILLEILAHLDARERAVLASFSERFDRLVYSEKKLFTYLNFSKNGRLNSASDIQRYFENEITNSLIVKVNLQNVICMDSRRLFNDCINKALNLVDINIHGIQLEHLHQLGTALKPLVLLKRLSIDWPLTEDGIYQELPQVINELFSKLVYLSVRTLSCNCFNSFITVSYVCQELKELRVVNGREEDNLDFYGPRDVTALQSLECFEFCGDYAAWMKDDLLHMLPDPESWIGFKLPYPLDDKCFYLVKDLDICKELEEIECVEDLPDSWEWYLGSRLRWEWLLKAVIRITQENVPEKFCSRLSGLDGDEFCALKIKDAKLLLKNPRHQVEYLYLKDSIGTKCETHLYSLACPSLTELYLSDVIRIETSTASRDIDSQEQNNFADESEFDFSFRMLVENTPLVKNLTLNGRLRNILASEEIEVDATWDLSVLSLIRGWKSLRLLRLLWLPIRDGEFLIEIGEQCEYLEKLELYELGPKDACCYTSELSVMLSHCQNLTDFSIRADNFGDVSQVFASLAKNQKLRRVRLKSLGEMNNTRNLIPAVEQLLRRCCALTTFLCIVDGISQADSRQLTSALRRLRTELKRPSLQFQVTRKGHVTSSSEVDSVFEDSVIPSFPFTWEECSYS